MNVSMSNTAKEIKAEIARVGSEITRKITAMQGFGITFKKSFIRKYVIEPTKTKSHAEKRRLLKKLNDLENFGNVVFTDKNILEYRDNLTGKVYKGEKAVDKLNTIFNDNDITDEPKPDYISGVLDEIDQYSQDVISTTGYFGYVGTRSVLDDIAKLRQDVINGQYNIDETKYSQIQALSEYRYYDRDNYTSIHNRVSGFVQDVRRILS